MPRLPIAASLAAFTFVLSACSGSPRFGQPGRPAFERAGDEIVVAGQHFHTGTPVVLWTDPGGYDAYRVERRFVPFEDSAWDKSADKLDTPNRYGLRHRGNWPPEVLEEIRGGGWTLDRLRDTVDLFVIHYDACGTSRKCFEVLHDHRGLSIHFMLDVDGTIYQTLDLKERAWHAGPANDRSIGIEIANIGAYEPEDFEGVAEAWYLPDEKGGVRLVVPEDERPHLRKPDLPLRPARPKPVAGTVNGRDLRQYDLTPEQYASLEKLTAALRRVFPKLEGGPPRDAEGEVLFDRALTPEELASFSGIIGHHHITPEKVDPGPAFRWERLDSAR